jgi:hypothetical protein
MISRMLLFVLLPAVVLQRKSSTVTVVVGAFRPATLVLSTPNKSLSLLFMAGKGMGMAPTNKAKKGKSSSSSSSQPFNVNASVLRLGKAYDNLLLQHAKTLQKDDDEDSEDDSNKISIHTVSTMEYVIAARAKGHVADWVPIAQICLARHPDQVGEGVRDDPILQAVVSQYCRELSYVASLGSRVFQSVPRNLLEYSVETIDSFQKFVYDPVLDGGVRLKKKTSDEGSILSKQQAREILNLPDTINGSEDDRSLIKQSYRKLAFEWHSDRFAKTERTDEEIQHASNMYARIKVAYDTLTSGVKNSGTLSWYESLGGRARTDFAGPISLIPLSKAAETIQANKVESGLSGLDPDLVQSFVARSWQ